MRRIPLARGIVATLALCALRLRAAAPEAEGAAGAGDPWLLWKWVNFVILFAALGYLISKSAGAYFRSRTASIQKGIAESGKRKKDAEASVAEIGRKIAALDQEVGQLRSNAKTAFAAEGLRIEGETAQALDRLRRQSEHEIAAMVKEARMELRTQTAKLALEMASRQVRETLTAAGDRILIDGFTRDLGERAVNAGERT